METEQFFSTLRKLREDGKSFSSHDFIKCFSKNYQREYILMLYEKIDTASPFNTVHSQIGRELEKNQNNNSLPYKKAPIDKQVSENLFGNDDYIQFWVFIN